MRKVGAIIGLAALLLNSWTSRSLAAPGQLQIIEDAEIEHTLRTFVQPIFDVAGLGGEQVRIALINDDQINSFVAGGPNIFINTGLLAQADGPLEIIGVIAHETGHIADGHLIRTREELHNASMQAILSALLGAAALAGSAAAGGGGGAGGAGAMIIGAGSNIAQANYLSFSRGQEAAADQAALRFLDEVHWSARGLLGLLNKLKDQELLPESQQVEYLQTHPLTQTRIDAVQYHVDHSPYSNAPLPPGFERLFRRMQAKLMGFMHPAEVARRYPASDHSISARYARCIAAYREDDLADAVPEIDALIKDEPKNPFFYELKGQMLFEHSRIAESIPPYRKAVELMPSSALLQTELGHALIESHDPALLGEALTHLKKSAEIDSTVPLTWRLMATVYGRQGNDPMVAYAMAEDALSRGDKPAARYNAEKAEHLLPAGSPAWIRAQDIRSTTGG